MGKVMRLVDMQDIRNDAEKLAAWWENRYGDAVEHWRHIKPSNPHNHQGKLMAALSHAGEAELEAFQFLNLYYHKIARPRAIKRTGERLPRNLDPAPFV